MGKSRSLYLSLQNNSGLPVVLHRTTSANPFSPGRGDCPNTLPASASCTFPVTYSPYVSGSAAGTLMIYADAFGSGRSVPWTGVGVLPTATPTPTWTATPTTTPTTTITPTATRTPIVFPPTPIPLPEDEYTDEEEEELVEQVYLGLNQVGEVKQRTARLRVLAYAVDGSYDPTPLEDERVSVTCIQRRTEVTRSGSTDAEGGVVVRLTRVAKGMTCRASGEFSGQTEQSDRVKLK